MTVLLERFTGCEVQRNRATIVGAPVSIKTLPPNVPDLIARYAPSVVAAGSNQPGFQSYQGDDWKHVTGIIARLSLCQSAALGRRRYQCDDCQEHKVVYNSCAQRHCPRCSKVRRKQWLAKMAAAILPRIEYLQIVLTIPDRFAGLALANRAKVYSMLMRTAWSTIKGFLKTFGIDPAATLVLHTWNHRLQIHPHIHAILPAGGPSLAGDRWVTISWAEKEVLKQELGARFRELFNRGILRLHRRGELQLVGTLVRETHQEQSQALGDWLSRIAPRGYHTFVQSPPQANMGPKQILNYLASYITGSPIANSRLVSDQDGQVTFMARPGKKPPSGDKPKSVPIQVSGVEFARRWALHILPKQFVRVRHYGRMCHCNRKAYVAQCQKLLGGSNDASSIDDGAVDPSEDSTSFDLWGLDEDEKKAPTCYCPKCKKPMVCVELEYRPSWRTTMNSSWRPDWYP